MSRVVVTAQMLEDWHRAGRPIEAPRDALITPAARDWLKERAIAVTWREGDGGAAESLPVVIDLTTPMMRSVLTAIERLAGGVETIDPAVKAGGLLPAVSRLCSEIATGARSRGVVFTEDGALAACLACKFAGVRATVGASLPAVEQAVRTFAANVLVVEPSRQTTYQIRQMVERFLKLRPAEAAQAAIETIRRAEGGNRADR